MPRCRGDCTAVPLENLTFPLTYRLITPVPEGCATGREILMRRSIMWCLAVVSLSAGGCSGQHVFTVPDQVATVGGETATVVRLQKQEFASLYLPVKEALVRIQTESGPLRGAFTDKQGYAFAAAPVGSTTGMFYMHLAYTNNLRGDEYDTYVPTYVWDPQCFVTAVDLEALPLNQSAGPSQDAMAKLAGGSYVIYFTPEDVSKHESLHQRLKQAGYPDGPIFQWQREAWRVEKDPKTGIPHLVMAGKMISTLEYLKVQFPHLQAGVASTRLGRATFEDAGMKVVTLQQAAETYGTQTTTTQPTTRPTPKRAPTTAPATQPHATTRTATTTFTR